MCHTQVHIHVITVCVYVVCTVQGVVDLFWLPVQQYQEDGRVLWGIQRGASSFATSSGVAVVELTNRLLQSVQVSVCTVINSHLSFLHLL